MHFNTNHQTYVDLLLEDLSKLSECCFHWCCNSTHQHIGHGRKWELVINDL